MLFSQTEGRHQEGAVILGNRDVTTIEAWKRKKFSKMAAKRMYDKTGSNCFSTLSSFKWCCVSVNTCSCFRSLIRGKWILISSVK